MRAWNLFFFNIGTQTKDVEQWVLSDILVPNSWEVAADRKNWFDEELFNFLKY
jgi:hypothetical protein